MEMVEDDTVTGGNNSYRPNETKLESGNFSTLQQAETEIDGSASVMKAERLREEKLNMLSRLQMYYNTVETSLKEIKAMSSQM
mmetsp:Transcript_7889/g.12213  ORF Transcript_7889/g.12213 Transcript_7889/m.12213 type:complete len:83 (+) Transcript_7889:980-1228(+)